MSIDFNPNQKLTTLTKEFESTVQRDEKVTEKVIATLEEIKKTFEQDRSAFSEETLGSCIQAFENHKERFDSSSLEKTTQIFFHIKRDFSERLKEIKRTEFLGNINELLQASKKRILRDYDIEKFLTLSEKQDNIELLKEEELNNLQKVLDSWPEMIKKSKSQLSQKLAEKSIAESDHDVRIKKHDDSLKIREELSEKVSEKLKELEIKAQQISDEKKKDEKVEEQRTIEESYQRQIESIKAEKTPGKQVDSLQKRILDVKETVITIEGKKVDEKIETIKIDRLARLQHLEEMYDAMFPSGKLAEGQYSVTTKYFPKTAVWYVGGTWKEGEDGFWVDMQKIGKKNGIKVISDLPESKRGNLQSADILFLDTANEPYEESRFSQDFVDFTPTEIRIPRMKFNEDCDIRISELIKSERGKRDSLWGETGADEITARGVPYDSESSKKAIYLATAIGVPISMNLTYSEGGNTLIGEDEGGPYAIIGMDSFSATKIFMEIDLGYYDPETGQHKGDNKVSEEEIKMAFALDYGIPKERIHFIEQPGDFHLDMSMTILGKNTIILNDSVASFKEYNQTDLENLKSKESLSKIEKEQVEKLKKIAELRKKFEDKVENQLKEKNYEVNRVAGRFNIAGTGIDPEVSEMNFFNMVTATVPNPEQKIIIAMGCKEEKYEQNFIKMIRNQGFSEEEIPKESIYFLNFEKSKGSLILNGGIACCTKTIPKFID